MSHQILNQIRKEIDAGNVRESRHMSNLSLFKYRSMTCKWNKTTERCRGIIFNRDTGRIVCRPFDKFFNLDERPSTKRKYVMSRAKTQDFIVTEKMDGSMLAIWFYEDRWLTSTPGSIDSPQAKYARNELLGKYNLKNWPKDLTYVCELITPMDRKDKVVDYGDRDELILLSAFENKWEQTEVPFGRVKSFATMATMPLVPVWQSSKEDFLSLKIPDNTEGYVIAFPNFRVKIKSLDYVRAFRLLSDFNSKHIFEYIRKGSYFEAAKILHESKRIFFDDLYAKIMQTKGEVEEEVVNWLLKCDSNNMKESALLMQEAKLDKRIQGIIFMKFKGKNEIEEDLIWKLTKERFDEQTKGIL